jgi:hypothetical protein
MRIYDRGERYAVRHELRQFCWRCVAVWIVVAWMTPEPPPIIGPGPCHSDTIWGCYAHRLWLPVIGG